MKAQRGNYYIIKHGVHRRQTAPWHIVTWVSRWPVLDVFVAGPRGEKHSETEKSNLPTIIDPTDPSNQPQHTPKQPSQQLLIKKSCLPPSPVYQQKTIKFFSNYHRTFVMFVKATKIVPWAGRRFLITLSKLIIFNCPLSLAIHTQAILTTALVSF